MIYSVVILNLTKSLYTPASVHTLWSFVTNYRTHPPHTTAALSYSEQPLSIGTKKNVWNLLRVL